MDDISGSDENNTDVFASKSESPSDSICQGQRALSLPLEGYKEFVYLLRVIKGGSSRKPMVMWNFSGTPGGGTWLSPGQTMSWPTSLIVFLCNELSFSPDVHFVWQNYKLVIFLYF